MRFKRYFTSPSFDAYLVKVKAHSLTSFSLPASAASTNINNGTFVSKKELDTWSVMALRIYNRRENLTELGE